MEIPDGEPHLSEFPPQLATGKLFAAARGRRPFLSVVEAAVASLARARFEAGVDAALFAELEDLADQFLVRHGVAVRPPDTVASS